MITSEARKALFVLSLIMAFLVCLSLPSVAQEWQRFRIGDASIEVPADWEIVHWLREREYTLKSPNGVFELRVEWWLPDEPLLGYADIVWHRKVNVAGQSAIMIYSKYPEFQTLLVALEKPRQDGRQLLFVLSAMGMDLQNGSPLLDGILARLRLAP